MIPQVRTIRVAQGALVAAALLMGAASGRASCVAPASVDVLVDPLDARIYGSFGGERAASDPGCR